MAKRKRTKTGNASKASPVPQHFPFLQLPAELRNTIYELAATEPTLYTIRHDRAYYKPPLSPVCRQLRQEYQQIYMSEAPKFAYMVNVHITNFVWNTESVDIAQAIQSLPPLSIAGDRTYTLCISLDYSWATGRKQLSTLLGITAAQVLPPFNVRFQWDWKRLFRDGHWAWSLEQHFEGNLSKQFQVALDDAFERYAFMEAEQETESGDERKQKRKRPTGTQKDGMASKRQRRT